MSFLPVLFYMCFPFDCYCSRLHSVVGIETEVGFNWSYGPAQTDEGNRPARLFKAGDYIKYTCAVVVEWMSQLHGFKTHKRWVLQIDTGTLKKIESVKMTCIVWTDGLMNIYPDVKSNRCLLWYHIPNLSIFWLLLSIVSINWYCYHMHLIPEQLQDCKAAAGIKPEHLGWRCWELLSWLLAPELHPLIQYLYLQC